jgi:hypothetical protein
LGHGRAGGKEQNKNHRHKPLHKNLLTTFPDYFIEAFPKTEIPGKPFRFINLRLLSQKLKFWESLSYIDNFNIESAGMQEKKLVCNPVLP